MKKDQSEIHLLGNKMVNEYSSYMEWDSIGRTVSINYFIY